MFLTLDLTRMQIHRNDVICSSDREHVRHQLGTDRRATLRETRREGDKSIERAMDRQRRERSVIQANQ